MQAFTMKLMLNPGPNKCYYKKCKEKPTLTQKIFRKGRLYVTDETSFNIQNLNELRTSDKIRYCFLILLHCIQSYVS